MAACRRDRLCATDGGERRFREALPAGPWLSHPSRPPFVSVSRRVRVLWAPLKSRTREEDGSVSPGACQSGTALSERREPFVTALPSRSGGRPNPALVGCERRAGCPRPSPGAPSPGEPGGAVLHGKPSSSPWETCFRE